MAAAFRQGSAPPARRAALDLVVLSGGSNRRRQSLVDCRLFLRLLVDLVRYLMAVCSGSSWGCTLPVVGDFFAHGYQPES